MAFKTKEIMETITTVDELKTLIKEKVLPAYEAAYADENSDFKKLYMDKGICWYCRIVTKTRVYRVLQNILSVDWICEKVINDGYTKDEAILPRIEWMKKFINQ